MRIGLPRGWSIEMPGDLDHGWHDDETWEAHDEGSSRNVYVTIYSVPEPIGPQELLELLDDPPEVVEHRRGELLGYGSVRPNDDGTLIVHGVSYVPGTAAICTITLSDSRHLPWALDTWRSLRVTSRKG